MTTGGDLYSSYIGTSREEQQKMLESIGKKSMKELFTDLPEGLYVEETMDIPGPYSEAQLTRIFKKISEKNSDAVSFLGGGVREVYIPAFLEELIRRGEIYTAYTSYQPEVAQGMLQFVFEYESLVAELTGMDVINASLYDWASAVGEACRMMVRIQKRRTDVILADPISPRRKKVAHAYTDPAGINLIEVKSEGGINTNKIKELITRDAEKDKKERKIAGLYFEVPTYHGVLPNEVKELIEFAHEHGVLVTVGVDIVSLGIIEPPGSYNADFIVGEGQLLGNSVGGGGPLLGILGSKYNRKWIQNYPGRLVGITTDYRDGKESYAITLSTREQHIRREKATSNICSNQTLMAVVAGIYAASLGPKGFEELAQGLYDRAHYLAGELNKLEKVNSPLFDGFFAEFVISIEGVDHDTLEKECVKRGVIPGIRLEGEGCRRLIAVSDVHTKQDLDLLVEVLKEVLN